MPRQRLTQIYRGQVVERGASSLQSLLSMALFTVLPTIIDLLLACAVLLYLLEPMFAIVIFSTIFAYMYITVALTDWRKKFRRAMIETVRAATLYVLPCRGLASALSYGRNRALFHVLLGGWIA